MTAFKTRSGSSSNDSILDVNYWRNDGTQTTLVNESQRYASLNYREFKGADVPGFHKLLKKGKIVPHTPWHQWSILSAACTGVHDYYYNLNEVTNHVWMEPIYGPTSISDAWVPTEEEVAAYASDASKFAQEAAAKIYSSGFDALTFVAELTEVKRMFEEVGRKLLSLPLPKKWRGLKLELKERANDWLSWRYGWRVLMYDIKNINELIQSYNVKRQRYSEKCGTQYSESYITDCGTQEATYYYYDEIRSNSITVSLRGSVVADIAIPKLQFNPFVTAWEIVPLSFVVDWFVSVGKALSSASFLTFQSDYAASCGYRIEFNRIRDRQISSTKDSFISGDHSLYSDVTCVLEKRSPCSVPLTPHLTCRLNPSKIIDLVGLVVQRIK